MFYSTKIKHLHIYSPLGYPQSFPCSCFPGRGAPKEILPPDVADRTSFASPNPNSAVVLRQIFYFILFYFVCLEHRCWNCLGIFQSWLLSCGSWQYPHWSIGRTVKISREKTAFWGAPVHISILCQWKAPYMELEQEQKEVNWSSPSLLSSYT